MKLPRNAAARDLIKGCAKLGYEVSRQSGSHIRLTTLQNGQHHITIPNHDPLKVGTLSAILSDISNHFHTTREEIIKLVFYS